MQYLSVEKINEKILVDDVDFKYLNKFKFYLAPGSSIYTNFKGRRVGLNKLLLNPIKGFEVDHINGDIFDNRRENLRICTHQQNQFNRCQRKDSQTNSKGTQKIHPSRWRTRIKIDNKICHIGYFKTEHQAALAYDLWAKDLFGEFAKTNFI